MLKNWALPLCVEQYGICFRITELEGCTVEDIAGLFSPFLQTYGPKFINTPEFRFRPVEKITEIFSIIAPLYVQHGFFPIHAAGIVIGQQGVLCVGPSGSGKSSFARAAYASGLKIIGDDIVLLHGKKEKIELLPWIYSIQQKAEIKHPVFLDPGAFASAYLGAVLFSEIGTGSSSAFMRSASPSALSQLSLQLLWSADAREIFFQRDLIQQLATFPSIEVLFGKDILENPSEFIFQLDRILQTL